MAIEDIRFTYAGGLGLRLRANPAIRRFFAAEYQWAAAPPSLEPSDVSVSVARVVRARQRGGTIRGGYKTIAWRVRLSDAASDAIGVDIELSGVPLHFGLSLTQGYLIEPLLSLAAPARGQVLLPAAAIAIEGGALVIMGRSRSGKSTVSARALAAGWPVLGDDQIVIDDQGRCTAFPRRMRLYSDLEETAPDAHAALPGSSRRALAIRKRVRSLSRGYVAPPVRVPSAAIGPAAATTALPIVELVLIERSDTARTIAREPLDMDDIALCASTLLSEQRTHLARDPAWNDRIDAVAAREAFIVRSGLAAPRAHRVVVPSSFGASEAISGLGTLLGLAGPAPGPS